MTNLSNCCKAPVKNDSSLGKTTYFCTCCWRTCTLSQEYEKSPQENYIDHTMNQLIDNQALSSNMPIFSQDTVQASVTGDEGLRSDFFLHIADFSDDNHHDVEPYSMQKIADFWLAKFHSQNERLVERIEGKRKNSGECTCDGSFEPMCTNCEYDLFNQGLEVALTIIREGNN